MDDLDPERLAGLRTAYLRFQRLLAAKGTNAAPPETVALISETLDGIDLDPLSPDDRVLLWRRVSDVVIATGLVADELARTLELMHGVERAAWQAEVDGHFEEYLAALAEGMRS